MVNEHSLEVIMDNAFVYKWTHLPTLKWYIGVSAGKKKNYICSSKILLQLIKANPNEWERTIIATGTFNDMYNFETEILQTFDARNDKRSFNRHNNEGTASKYGHVLTEETKQKIGNANKGKTGIKLRGRQRPPEVKEKIRQTMLGQKYSQERCDAMKAGWQRKKETN